MGGKKSDILGYEHEPMFLEWETVLLQVYLLRPSACAVPRTVPYSRV